MGQQADVRENSITHRVSRVDDNAAELFVLSSVALFVEMALMRFIPGEVRIVAYFSNLLLLASFFGLGLGFLLAGRKLDLFPYFPVPFALVAAMVWVMRSITVTPIGVDEVYWLAYGETHTDMGLLPAIIVIYVLVAAVFVPMGQMMGRLFTSMTPLRAYAYNICGSIFGVMMFAAASHFQTGPAFWLAMVALPLALIYWASYGRVLVPAVVLAVLVAVFSAGTPATVRWSPYYKVELETLIPGKAYKLTVNKDNHQWPFQLTNGPALSPTMDMFGKYYNFVYKLRRFGNVLILGAGTGNDVAAALMNGANRITAVEIDPVILDIGRKLHPNKPYSNPRVKAINGDARNFIARTAEKYDLVVYGLLDSHTLHSNLPGIRLDNYVYTTEGIREAAGRLSGKGVLALSFLNVSDWVSGKLYRMVRAATGHAPLRITHSFGPYEIETLLAGPGVKAISAGLRNEAPTGYLSLALDMPTDDWPYLYLQKHEFPEHYAVILAAIVLVSALAFRAFRVRINEPSALGGHRGGAGSFHAGFFFLGAGFMLLETRAITVMSLSFGSTWAVGTVVIMTVLVFILAGTLAAHLMKRPAYIRCHAALWASIGMGWAAYHYLNHMGESAHHPYIFGAVSMLPVFFAAVLFALYFKRSRNRARALGSNLIGGVCGGFGEYVSMYFGLNSLWWVALMFYFLSFTFFAYYDSLARSASRDAALESPGQP